MSTTRGGDEAMKDLNWAELSKKLPTGLTRDDKQKRRQVFNRMDMNGNNYLSLAEVDKGVRDILKCDHLFNAKPVMLRAFNAVKDTAPAHTPHSDDYVTRSEFRLLLVALRQMFELWVMFEIIDTGDDRRIDLGEFTKASEQLKAWGVKIDDPEATFKEVDKNGGGQILFNEFVDWAMKKGLDLEDDDD
eukprot:TRINITY_DN3219_c0_g1_i1.p1 TRINITY_DN3219_c0_g1~~TRINITY_DN3219_c0_g1_i1.p1  ORF type:complete len:189 (+),score=113.83 TRINITY_DN3219_c0_g1_i1:69-635(+)